MTDSYKNYNTTEYGDINGNGSEEPLIIEMNTGEGFKPIGNVEQQEGTDRSGAFQGTFDGRGHTLNNIYENREKLHVDIATGQGGTFDYEAGRIKRAPVLIQKIGMEWLWRLILEPKRIIRMSVLPVYVVKLFFSKDKTKGKFTNASL